MSKAARQRSARDRLAEERQRQQARQKKLRALLVSAGAVVVIAVVVVAVVLVQSGKDDEGGDVALAPVTRQADGSVVMAKAGVQGPVLEIYEDFQCPSCKNFEKATGKTVKALASEGKAKVVYRPFSLFKDWPEPTKGNSARALNASFCAPVDKWMTYHDKLFGEQGPENSAGFANKDLISWAGGVGIPAEPFGACVNGTQQAAKMTQANDAAKKAGVDGTPYVLLNGKKLGQDATFTAKGLRNAVEGAAKQ